ncbi:15314_t:CDS:2, partial [Cetraspora pellucida]
MLGLKTRKTSSEKFTQVLNQIKSEEIIFSDKTYSDKIYSDL